LARLRDEYAEFTSRGADVVAVGPDSATAFRLYWDMQEIPFVGLPDPGHAVAMRYKQEVNLFKLGRMPLVMVVDAQGMIRFAHYGASMSDIPSNRELLDVIDQLNSASNE
jgi:peroxiredoxin Q/BCP